jgi:hypothetical protein
MNRHFEIHIDNRVEVYADINLTPPEQRGGLWDLTGYSEAHRSGISTHLLTADIRTMQEWYAKHVVEVAGDQER